MGMRIADPKPSFCSACHNLDLEARFVDLDAAFDAGAFVGPELQYVSGSDDLYLCEHCLRDAMEVLEMKPMVQAAQRNEIHRLKLENDHWREYAKKLEATLEARPEPAPHARRKIAA